MIAPASGRDGRDNRSPVDPVDDHRGGAESAAIPCAFAALRVVAVT